MAWVQVPAVALLGCVALGFAAGWLLGRDARDNNWLDAADPAAPPVRLGDGPRGEWRAVTAAEYTALAARRAWAEPGAKPDIRISEPYPAALQTSRRPE